ncbi:MAG: hypothetical protein F4176_03005 [Acidimicrobiia bacterium]|nr:hypothetical protein [Acidimicrobiia bacterium]
MDPADQASSPHSTGERNGRPGRRARSRGPAGFRVALGSALLAAAATTTALWLAGAFDREIVRITEVVEVREVVQGAAPQDTPAQPDLTTASTGPTASDDAEPSPSEEVTTPATGPETPPSVTTAPVFAPADLVAVVASRAIPSIVTVQNLDEA